MEGRRKDFQDGNVQQGKKIPIVLCLSSGEEEIYFDILKRKRFSKGWKVLIAKLGNLGLVPPHRTEQKAQGVSLLM